MGRGGDEELEELSPSMEKEIEEIVTEPGRGRLLWSDREIFLVPIQDQMDAAEVFDDLAAEQDETYREFRVLAEKIERADHLASLSDAELGYIEDGLAEIDLEFLSWNEHDAYAKLLAELRWRSERKISAQTRDSFATESSLALQKLGRWGTTEILDDEEILEAQNALRQRTDSVAQEVLLLLAREQRWRDLR